ncbi:MAG: MFS transporter [Chloroflexota bacterium]
MTNTITNAEKIRKLPWGIATDTGTAVYAQLTFFGTVFVLFLDELDFSKSQIGFLLSLMTFFGMIALFVAPTVARYGYKRSFILFWLLRKLSTVLLFFTPWVSIRFGFDVTFFYVAGVIILFALCRSIAITAYFPWLQESVPNSVRGKFTATKNMYMTIAGLIAVTGAGYFIEYRPGINSFMILFGVGLVFGLFSVWAATFIPGGAPVDPQEMSEARPNLIDPLKDGDFVRYVVGAGIITLVIVPLTSFLPLFMQEEVGLSSGNTILLQTGTMLGGLVSTYFWGWTADRYGSKPIVLSGICLLMVLPVCWMLMPRQSDLSLYAALAISFLQGVGFMGWTIGAGRLLFVSVVPEAQKMAYMAVYYAAVDVTGGVSKILGGQVIERTASLSGTFLGLTLDPYTPLFVLGVIGPIMSLILLRRVRSDTSTTLGQFAGLFIQGNPYMAIRSLIAFNWARDEAETIATTEHLGQARSALAVEELLVSLEDPRFNVRFETIISIARTRPDPRLTEALINLLNGTELSLTVVAAWALGRIGDPAAVPALRQGLQANYRSIRAHSARALATLGDDESAPQILTDLSEAEDKGLRMAYASALGKLGVEEAADDMLDLLAWIYNEGARRELALSIARLIGQENQFIRLLRQIREDRALGASQAVIALKRKTSRRAQLSKFMHPTLTDCADAFARDDVLAGLALLNQIVKQIPASQISEIASQILQTSLVQLEESNGERDEYLVLALHALTVGWTRPE